MISVAGCMHDGVRLGDAQTPRQTSVDEEQRPDLDGHDPVFKLVEPEPVADTSITATGASSIVLRGEKDGRGGIRADIAGGGVRVAADGVELGTAQSGDSVRLVARGAIVSLVVDDGRPLNWHQERVQKQGYSGVWHPRASTPRVVGGSAPGPASIALVSVSRDAIVRLHPTCDEPGYLPCYSAVSRYCTAQGFASGFGPVTWLGGEWLVTCGAPPALVTARIAGEKFYPAGGPQAKDCYADVKPCRPLVDAACKALGYEAGISLAESTSAEAVVVCAPKARRLKAPVEARAQDSSVHRFCEERGSLTGAGPLNDAGEVACLDP